MPANPLMLESCFELQSVLDVHSTKFSKQVSHCPLATGSKISTTEACNEKKKIRLRLRNFENIYFKETFHFILIL